MLKKDGYNPTDKKTGKIFKPSGKSLSKTGDKPSSKTSDKSKGMFKRSHST